MIAFDNINIVDYKKILTKGTIIVMRLVHYDPSFQGDIENYYVEDLSYTGLPKDILENAKETFFPVLCFEKNQLVCFFVLDSGEDKFKYTEDKNSLLLRAFSTDSRQTRKGYATAALNQLPSFMRAYFPAVANIYLGVNKKNEVAINMYEKVGFGDTHRTFNGPKGIQKILTLKV